MTAVVDQNGMDLLYSELVFSDFFLFENREPYFQERLVQIIWNEGLLIDNAMLADGRKLKVIHPGVWNLEAGPDFKESTLLLDDTPAHGAVEIHIRPSDWKAHGHDEDPAYDNVKLHVVWEDPAGHTAYPPEIPLLVLKEQICRPIDQIIEDFNVADYPYSKQVQPIPWAARVADMDDGVLTNLLHAYGLARILQKARDASELIQRFGLNVAAYHLICDALGYKNNRAQFAELAELLPLGDFDGLTEEERMALLFGAAGLLPDPCTLDVLPHTKPLLSRLWAAWWSRRREFREIQWNRQQRPYNSPERRLLSLALLLENTKNRPGDAIINSFSDAHTPKEVIHHLYSWLVLESDRWKRFYRFDKELDKGAALLGRSRADDFIVNAAIPLFFAWCFIKGDSTACYKGRDVLLMMGRLQPNRAFKEAVAHLIVPPSRASCVLTDACAQQGLLKLYRSFFELAKA